MDIYANLLNNFDNTHIYVSTVIKGLIQCFPNS